MTSGEKIPFQTPSAAETSPLVPPAAEPFQDDDGSWIMVNPDGSVTVLEEVPSKKSLKANRSQQSELPALPAQYPSHELAPLPPTKFAVQVEGYTNANLLQLMQMAGAQALAPFQTQYGGMQQGMPHQPQVIPMQYLGTVPHEDAPKGKKRAALLSASAQDQLPPDEMEDDTSTYVRTGKGKKRPSFKAIGSTILIAATLVSGPVFQASQKGSAAAAECVPKGITDPFCPVNEFASNFNPDNFLNFSIVEKK